MKKFIFLSLLMLACIAFAGCSACQSEQKQHAQELEAVVDTTQEATQEIAEYNVENTISTDREYMYLNYGSNYRWYETTVVMKDFADKECDGTVDNVTNTFYYVTTEDSISFDAVAVMSYYDGGGKHGILEREGLWVGDWPMNEDAIKITFKEAFELMMECNLPKPHSRYCVLRREIGSKADVAPQYIFGNTRRQIYVDATSGAVTDVNPAYVGLNKPLGEWP